MEAAGHSASCGTTKAPGLVAVESLLVFRPHLKSLYKREL